MPDIKTITQELTDASLELSTAVDEVLDLDIDNIKTILQKIVEKLDEVVTKINE